MAAQTPEQRQLEAIAGHLQRMNQVISALEDRMNRLEATSNEASTSNKGKEPATDDPPKEEDEVEPEDEEELEDSIGSRTKRSKDNNLGSIKLKIPEFKGESNPEFYLEWEDKVEKIFDIHDYSEKKKVKLAVVEFSGYASTWWRKLCRSR